MSATVPFPTETTLFHYLARHRETRDVYLEDGDAVKAVAHFFGGRNVSWIRLNAGIALTQYNAMRQNKIPPEKIAAIQSKFTTALKDWKKQKPLPNTTNTILRIEDDLQLTKALDIVAISYIIGFERRLRANL